MERRPVSIGEAVVFDWVDSSASNGWQLPSPRNLKLLKITTMGFIVGANEEAISVSTSIANDGQAMDALSVPWGCITKMVELPEQWAFDGDRSEVA